MSDLEEAGRRFRESALVSSASIADVETRNKRNSFATVTGIAMVLLVVAAVLVPLRSNTSYRQLAGAFLNPGAHPEAMVDYAWYGDTARQYSLSHGEPNPRVQLVDTTSEALATKLVGQEIRVAKPGDFIYIVQGLGGFDTSPETNGAGGSKPVWVAAYLPGVGHPTPTPIILEWRDSPLDFASIANEPRSVIQVIDL